MANWINPSGYTYLLLDENANAEDVQAIIAREVERRTGQTGRQFNISVTTHLQKMTDIHLYSNLEFEHRANSDIKYILEENREWN